MHVRVASTTSRRCKACLGHLVAMLHRFTSVTVDAVMFWLLSTLMQLVTKTTFCGNDCAPVGSEMTAPFSVVGQVLPP